MAAPRAKARAHLLCCVCFALFALSGAAGLIYEIVWVRQLTLVLGASTYAVTTVLAVFMAGLGFGAWLVGKWADRFNEKQLARCYVALEVGIGAYAAMLPLVLSGAERFYAAVYQAYQPGLFACTAVRLLVTFLLLAIPTTLMGGTLPVMSRYLARVKSHVSVTVSWLYGLNTVGALFGVIAAGYFLLPNLGIILTTFSAVALNFAVAAGFFMIHAMSTQTRFVESLTESVGAVRVFASCEPISSRFEKGAVAAFAISGFAAMLYEVAWTRALTMVLGTTTFAFTIMLATFLLGIALGSMFFSLARRLATPAALLVGLQYTVAVSALLTIPLFERLPFLYLSLDGVTPNGWLSLQFVRFVLAGLVMLVPTFAMGLTFPVVAAILVDETGTIGRRLGRAYGLNTLGAVLGAVAGGLLLVPTIGMERTITAGALMNLVAGSLVMLLWMERSLSSRLLSVAGTSAGLWLLISLLAPWSPRLLNSGVYVYADRYHAIIDRVEGAVEEPLRISHAEAWKLWELSFKQYDLLYYRPGVTATVAVMQRPDGVRFLTIDGKTDASTSTDHDMKTQVMLGQLPVLFHPQPDKVFVVGLGSGVTVGSVLTHDVRVVDCAELSPAVVEASEFFSGVNHDPLRDQRLRLLQRDARNVLLTAPDRYDVVISQPSNPWIAGQSSLFSLEWYQLVEKRLRDGGMLAQWLPAYCTSEWDMKVIVHTMRSVFPHTTLWTSGAAGDVILLATKGEKLRIDYRLLRQRTARPAIHQDLLRIGCDPALVPFQTFVMDEEELGLFLYADLGRPLPKNRDDLLITEFSAPKHVVQNRIVRRFVDPEQLRGDVASLMKILLHLDDETLGEAFQRPQQSARRPVNSPQDHDQARPPKPSGSPHRETAFNGCLSTDGAVHRGGIRRTVSYHAFLLGSRGC
ncbi:MAG TPA: fused MFS/spermidine synthase [Thermoguttaceae bacterium]|nr:fused MFS/spermidine synthase [Thermoguttaceae bacterium]